MQKLVTQAERHAYSRNELLDIGYTAGHRKALRVLPVDVVRNVRQWKINL